MTARLWRGCAGRKRDQILYGPIPAGRSIDRWLSLDPNSTDGVVGWIDDDISDLVPLVTLTEGDARKIRDLIASRGFGPDVTAYSAYNNLCDQLAGSSRMEEPTEFGAMVEARHQGDRWVPYVRTTDAEHGGRWVCPQSAGLSRKWADLIDPRPVERPS